MTIATNNSNEIAQCAVFPATPPGGLRALVQVSASSSARDTGAASGTSDAGCASKFSVREANRAENLPRIAGIRPWSVLQGAVPSLTGA
jgi:hypothetical protein